MLCFSQCYKLKAYKSGSLVSRLINPNTTPFPPSGGSSKQEDVREKPNKNEEKEHLGQVTKFSIIFACGA